MERYWISWDDPLSARTEAEWKIGLARPDIDWEVRLEADTRIRCDAKNFYVQSVVTAFDHEEEIFHKEWERTVERTAS
ncbi:hypothetical protein [Actinotignum sp. GS-2025b]|uniref:hypothetical protein n=1 Tax=Actinotignum sp. GS-2025b TaxID=3427275 RepID=UPI003F483928